MNGNENAGRNSDLHAPCGQETTKRDKSTIAAIDVKLALLLIETPASTDAELAAKLGIGRQAVNRRKNSPAVQDAIRSTLSLPQKETRRLIAKAMARLELLLDHEDPKIKLAATLALVKLNPPPKENVMDFELW